MMNQEPEFINGVPSFRRSSSLLSGLNGSLKTELKSSSGQSGMASFVKPSSEDKKLENQKKNTGDEFGRKFQRSDQSKSNFLLGNSTQKYIVPFEKDKRPLAKHDHPRMPQDAERINMQYVRDMQAKTIEVQQPAPKPIYERFQTVQISKEQQQELVEQSKPKMKIHNRIAGFAQKPQESIRNPEHNFPPEFNSDVFNHPPKPALKSMTLNHPESLASNFWRPDAYESTQQAPSIIGLKEGQGRMELVPENINGIDMVIQRQINERGIVIFEKFFPANDRKSIDNLMFNTQNPSLLSLKTLDDRPLEDVQQKMSAYEPQLQPQTRHLFGQELKNRELGSIQNHHATSFASYKNSNNVVYAGMKQLDNRQMAKNDSKADINLKNIPTNIPQNHLTYQERKLETSEKGHGPSYDQYAPAPHQRITIKERDPNTQHRQQMDQFFDTGIPIPTNRHAHKEGERQTARGDHTVQQNFVGMTPLHQRGLTVGNRETNESQGLVGAEFKNYNQPKVQYHELKERETIEQNSILQGAMIDRAPSPKHIRNHVDDNGRTRVGIALKPGIELPGKKPKKSRKVPIDKPRHGAEESKPTLWDPMMDRKQFARTKQRKSKKNKQYIIDPQPYQEPQNQPFVHPPSTPRLERDPVKKETRSRASIQNITEAQNAARNPDLPRPF